MVCALESFTEAYRHQRVVFLAGAGASFDSAAPMPGSILASSARLFLPTEPALATLVSTVLTTSAIPGGAFKGIQPEVFYEHLLAISRDSRTLALWRVLSPAWLSRQGAQLRPNANHFAVAQYGAVSGLPVFTVNFDTLFEDAARCLGQPEPEVLTPYSEAEAHAVERLMATGPMPGRLTLFKLHGSIALKGVESLETIRTTMHSITASNHTVLQLMNHLCRDRNLTFLGYSGCDIDYFPALAGFGLATRPFWFNPLSDKITRRNIERANAAELIETPSKLFQQLHPEFALVPRSSGVEPEPLLQQLEASCEVALKPAEKVLLLAMCLNSVGHNDAAEAVLHSSIDALQGGLDSRTWILALLLLARVQDCTSKYDACLQTALAAQRAITRSRQQGDLDSPQASAMEVRAIYHAAQARQQSIGPRIIYGDPRVDYAPPTAAFLKLLVSGTAIALRHQRLRRAFRAPSPRKDYRDDAALDFVRAEHAINDHLVLILGLVVAAAESMRLIRLRLVLNLLETVSQALLRRASRDGDYFTYAGAHKYLRRLRSKVESEVASDNYLLLRDPLNYALVKRDAAVSLLKAGKVADALTLFRQAADAAIQCGSRATALKALLGLHACGAAEERDREMLTDICGKIEGAGYRQYVARVMPQLLSDSAQARATAPPSPGPAGSP